MKKGFPLVLLAAVLLPECVSAPPEKPVRRNTGHDCSREIRIGDAVLKAMKNNRYRELTLLLREGPLSGMSEQDFRTSERNMRERFGRIRSAEFLTELRTPLVRNLVWKVRFERENREGGTLEQDMLFRLVTGTLDGRPVVLNFGFF